MTITTTVPGAVSHRELTYAEHRGFRPLLLDLHVPEDAVGPVPCVVWVHGGGWQWGDRRDTPDHWPAGWWFTELVRAGLAVATVDYRLAREARWPAQLDDIGLATAWLRARAGDLGLDPDRFGVAGESAGGHLAAMAALTGDGPSAFAAAVVLYGVTDVEAMADHGRAPGAPSDPEAPEVDLLGGPVPEHLAAARDASPVHHATAACPPVLLISGDRDALVPLDQSRRLHAALAAAGAPAVELEVVPGADHCFVGVDPVPPLRRCVDFLAGHLVRGRSGG